jgi:hypothetical protein
LTDTEQFDDLQMLAGLRHRAIVGGDDEQCEINTGGASQHVVNQLFVTWHVDETELFGVGVAEVDGDAARLLFLQAVAIDPGQGFDQRRLAVVDVAGGADDHGVCVFPINCPSIRLLGGLLRGCLELVEGANGGAGNNWCVK